MNWLFSYQSVCDFSCRNYIISTREILIYINKNYKKTIVFLFLEYNIEFPKEFDQKIKVMFYIHYNITSQMLHETNKQGIYCRYCTQQSYLLFSKNMLLFSVMVFH